MPVMDTTHPSAEDTPAAAGAQPAPEELLEGLTVADPADAPPIADRLAALLAARLDERSGEPGS